jgi:hypothetical protein
MAYKKYKLDSKALFRGNKKTKQVGVYGSKKFAGPQNGGPGSVGQRNPFDLTAHIEEIVTASADSDWVKDSVNGYVYNITENIGIGTDTPTGTLHVLDRSEAYDQEVIVTNNSILLRSTDNQTSDVVSILSDLIQGLALSADFGSSTISLDLRETDNSVLIETFDGVNKIFFKVGTEIGGDSPYESTELPEFEDDTAAGAGGVPVGAYYRTGSTVKQRQSSGV